MSVFSSSQRREESEALPVMRRSAPLALSMSQTKDS